MIEYVKRLLRRDRKPEAVMASTEATRSEANAAVERAESAIKSAIDRGPEITRVSNKVRYQTETNHFGEMIDKSMHRSPVLP